LSASNRGLFCVLRKQRAEKQEQAAALPRREATVFRVFRRRRARPACGVAICELSASNRGLFCVLRRQRAEKQPYPSTRLMR
jgi:hypothetical protein